MPKRNVIRQDLDNSFYHVYGRGSIGRTIFKDDQDKIFFLGLLERYLGRKKLSNKHNVIYPNFYGEVELCAYCLMGTHFHLLSWQLESGLVSQLMKSVLVSYTAYYNKRYKVRGPLLESRFLASLITEESYLLHLTRYIHLNPEDYRDYLWSSLGFYVAGLQEDWVKPDKIIDMFSLKPDSYWDLLKDYEEDKKDELNKVKSDFADGGTSLREENSKKPF